MRSSVANESRFSTLALRPQVETPRPPEVRSDNQAGIWVAGHTFYNQGRFLVAAGLFELANRLKPAKRISQNSGMAYFKAAHLPEYSCVLRLEYVRRSLPYLQSYRDWLANDYGRKYDIATTLAETDQ
jgi:hypothetical protein